MFILYREKETTGTNKQECDYCLTTDLNARFILSFDMMNAENNKIMFTELCTSIKQHAERLIPTLVDRAHQIDDLLRSAPFADEKSFRQTILDTARSAYVSQSTPPIIRANDKLTGIIRPVQNHLRDFVETVEHLTVWLELEIPSYIEGDDYRIVIQNEILDEIAAMKATTIAYLAQIVEYREQRSSASKELFKRPTLNDNYQLLINLDNQLYSNARLMLIEAQSNILRICNMLAKNKEIFLQQQSIHRQHVNNYF